MQQQFNNTDSSPSYRLEKFSAASNLTYTVVIPGCVRKRKSMASEDLIPIADEKTTMELFDRLVTSGNTPEATFLTLMQRYDINLDILESIGAKRLKSSFKRVRFHDIAPLFGLGPTDTRLSVIPEFEMRRACLPSSIVKSICQEVDVADVQYGQMITHNNEEARSRYISSIFNRIIYLFHRKLTNLPEGFLKGESTDRGRIEHQFVAFGAVVFLFIQVKKELLTGKSRQDQVAQAMAEADACDYQNASNLLWVPILGVLCDGEKFQFFVYDSSNRESSMSQRVTGLYQDEGDIRFLSSIKKTAEYMYDFFLAGFINGLRAFLDKTTKVTTLEGRKKPSTGKWIAALNHAEIALAESRHATTIGLQGRLEDAERIAKDAMENLRRSVEEAPDNTGKFSSIMEAWDELEVMRFSYP